jgi:hypothetical protein
MEETMGIKSQMEMMFSRALSGTEQARDDAMQKDGEIDNPADCLCGTAINAE